LDLLFLEWPYRRPDDSVDNRKPGEQGEAFRGWMLQIFNDEPVDMYWNKSGLGMQRRRKFYVNGEGVVR
jgi:hypothetical protein